MKPRKSSKLSKSLNLLNTRIAELSLQEIEMNHKLISCQSAIDVLIRVRNEIQVIINMKTRKSNIKKEVKSE